MNKSFPIRYFLFRISYFSTDANLINHKIISCYLALCFYPKTADYLAPAGLKCTQP